MANQQANSSKAGDQKNQGHSGHKEDHKGTSGSNKGSGSSSGSSSAKK